MDSSDEASSSAFINVTLAHIDAKPEAFFEACKRTLGLLAHAGFSSSELQIKFEENPAVWADRVFRNTSLTLICRGIEIGECLYLQDFPLSETEKINIIDVGIGLERLLWAQKGPENPYLSEYNSIYQSFSGLKIPHNQAFGIVDALRSMTLIALEGIEPSNKNQGYRLRQFSKRFISRSTGFKVDVNSIVTQAFKEWTPFGHLSAKDVSGVIEMIEKENSRNYNREILNNLKSNWKGVEVDINQSTKKFLEQLSHSVPQEEINRLIY